MKSGANPRNTIQPTLPIKTREIVSLLNTTYLNFLAKPGESGDREIVHVLTQKLNTLINQKIETSKQGKSKDEVIKKLLIELNKVDARHYVFKNLAMEALASIDTNPQAQVPAGRIFSSPYDVRREVSVLTSLVSPAAISKLSESVKNSELMSASMKKLDSVLNPLPNSFLARTGISFILTIRNAGLKTPIDNIPTLRGHLESMVGSWCQTIPINGVVDHFDTSNEASLSNKSRLLQKIKVMDISNGQRITVSDRTLNRARAALAESESKQKNGSEDSFAIGEEITLYKKIIQKCMLKQAAATRVNGIVDNLAKLHLVIPKIDPQDIADPLNLIVKLLDGIKTDPTLRKCLNEIISDESGLGGVIKETYGEKLSGVLTLLTQDRFMDMLCDVSDVLHLTDSDVLRETIRNPVGKIMRNDETFAELVFVFLRHIPDIMGSPENKRLLSSLIGSSQGVQELEAQLAPVHTDNPEEDVANSQGASPISRLLAKFVGHVSIKLSATQTGSVDTQFTDQFKEVTASINVFADSLIAYIAPEKLPRHDSFLGRQSVGFSALRDTVVTAIKDQSYFLIRDTAATTLGNKVNAMIETYSLVEEGVPKNAENILILDKEKVNRAVMQSVIFGGTLVKKNPILLDVFSTHMLNIVNTLKDIQSDTITTLGRRLEMLKTLSDSFRAMGNALLNTDSAVAHDIGHTMETLGRLIDGGFVGTVMDQSRIFSKDSLSVIVPLMLLNASRFMRIAESQVLRVVHEKLNPTSPTSRETERSRDMPISIPGFLKRGIERNSLVPSAMSIRSMISVSGLGSVIYPVDRRLLLLINSLK
jgi:hypothetical protein